MALEKTIVELPLDKGLNTKTNPKQEEPGFLQTAQNIVYETIKKLRKRNGYDNVLLLTPNNTRITGAIDLAKYKNELLLLTEDTLYAYSDTLERFIDKGNLYSVSANSRPVFKNANSQTAVDSLVSEGFEVFVWEEGSQVRYSVQDRASKSFIVSNGLIATGEAPVLAQINNIIFVVYGDGAALKFKTFSILDPETLSSATTASSLRETTDGLIDAQSAGSKIIVAFTADNSGDNLGLFSISGDSTVSSVLYINGETPSHALDLTFDSNSRIIITYSDGDYVKYLVYPLNLNASIVDPTIIEEIPNAAPSGTWNLTADITIDSATEGVARNGDTITLQVVAPAANPADTVLVAVTGTIDAVTVTVTPNDGTNNGAVGVDLTTEELVEALETGAVVGKNITLTDAGSLLTDLTFAGGDTTVLANAGEGDGVVATLADGTAFPITTCCSIETSPGNYRVYYEVDVASDENHYVKQADVDLAENVTNIAVFNRSVGLAARAFEYNDIIYVPVVHGSELQSTYFLLDEDKNLVTKWANQTAAGLVDYGVLQETSLVDDSEFAISYLFNNRLNDDNGTFFSTTGIGSVTINFTPSTTYSRAELAGGLHICAGLLRLYDGATLSEHGFTVFPETLSLASAAASGGALSDGSYGYKAVYKWTDNTGRDHRSAPTLNNLTVTLNGGGAEQLPTINIPTLRLTEKTNVAIELYRTEDAGTTYYKVTDDLSPLLNDETVDSVQFADTVSDADLINNEILYTTGGVLENLQAPAAYQITVHNGDRIAVIDENGYRVYFSKQIEENGPVEFTDSIYRDIDPTGGPASTIKGMNDKLIIFTQDACFFILGNGPNNTGAQDDLTKPEIIATDIGCTSPASAVLSPKGILFQSRKGIWILTPSLGLEYVGDRVETYNGETVTSAAVVGKVNQIRFLLAEKRALVFNYNSNRWATFANHGGLASVTIGDNYYYLREDGALYKENSSSFADADSPIKLKFETAWLPMDTIQGFGRVYRILILGDYRSAHRLKVRVAYNYIDAYKQEEIIVPSDFLNVTTYGEDSPYGEGTPYGGTGAPYQIRVDLEQQKVQAIKISVEDLQSTTGEALSISAITAEVGVKKGTMKLPATQQFGID